jgi:Tfp pilus assembly protein PilW
MPGARARRLRGQAGQTVVELSVTMVILGIVLAVFMGVLVWVQTALGREHTRSDTVDQARLALEALDREIRSGNILCGVVGDQSLSVYTQSNAVSRWVQYRISSQTLQRRQYSGSWTTWRTLATGITSGSFVVDTSATAGSRVVAVTLLVDTDVSDTTGSAIRVASSIAIRNQSTANPCASIPAG